MISAETVRKAIEQLRASEPMSKGPIRWSISEDVDGWMVCFSGAMNGAMHPKSFCQMIIQRLNE